MLLRSMSSLCRLGIFDFRDLLRFRNPSVLILHNIQRRLAHVQIDVSAPSQNMVDGKTGLPQVHQCLEED